MSLNCNQTLPEFSVTAYPEQTITRTNLTGKWTILYFYPKDDTPGCTQEGIEFEDRLTEFQALGAQVIGVSRDNFESHQKFSQKFNLTFPLICDTESELCNLFDVLKEKTNYGKTYIGIERSTFLIDPNATIRHEWRKVSVKDHVEAVLNELKAQNS